MAIEEDVKTLPMLEYNQYYRKYGIRKIERLMNPRIMPYSEFSFPKNAVYHYVPYDNTRVTPASDDYFIRSVSDKVLTSHVSELVSHLGNPKAKELMITSLVRQFHATNKRYRLLLDMEEAKRSPNTLFLVNYGFCSVKYKYMRTIMTQYYSTMNLLNTVINKIERMAVGTGREQFLFINLPDVPVGIPTLKLYSKYITRPTIPTALVQVFKTPELLMLLQFWNWIDENNREFSIFSKLSKETLSKLNIVFLDQGRWVLLNMGVLESFRRGDVVDMSVPALDPEQLQKRFMRMILSMVNVRVKDVEELADVAVQIDNGESSDASDDETISDGKITTPKGTIEQTDDRLYANKVKEFDGKDPDDNSPIVETVNQQMVDTLDEDLKQLDIAESDTLGNLSELLETKTTPHATSEQSGKLNPTQSKIDASKFNNYRSDPEAIILAQLDSLAKLNLMTPAEHRSMSKAASTYKRLPAPDGKGTLEEFTKITPEMLAIKPEEIKLTDRAAVFNKGMLASTLQVFDKDYINNILQKDIARAAIDIQKSGYILTEYNVERVEDVLGDVDICTIRLRPIEGEPSALRFQIPAINEDGVFMAGDVKYRLRKQKSDVPIRKAGPALVVLSSYTSKVLITRSEKKVNNYGDWLARTILNLALVKENRVVNDVAPSNVFNHNAVTPRVYSALAMSFKHFSIGKVKYILDWNEREKVFGPELLSQYEQKGMVFIGYSEEGAHQLIDENNIFYEMRDGGLIPLGYIESLLGVEDEKIPMDYAEVKVFGKNMPVGFILGFLLGLDKVIETLNIKTRIVQAGVRLNLDPSEVAIAFNDETLIYSRDDRVACLVLGGFKDYADSIRKFMRHTFNKQAVYFSVLESEKLPIRYLREAINQNDLFVDSITRDLLIEMGEPTSFVGLLFRSCELLLNDWHPNEVGMVAQRIRGYERIAGAVYNQLVQAVRQHKSSPGRHRTKVQMAPYAVWKHIMEDPAIGVVEDINPLKNIKESEAVTFTGVGGRINRSMTKKTRMYDKSDGGIISEASVYNGDVGINTYLSFNPKFKSLRGTAIPTAYTKENVASLVSTATLLGVASDRDDPKRAAFTSIQHEHGVSCPGYKVSPVRTGMAEIIAQRGTPMFSYVATGPGKVISKRDTGIIIQYEDGTKKGMPIGTVKGEAAGLTIPHEIDTDLKEGDVFKKGDQIVYNKGYFEKDRFNEGAYTLKIGAFSRVVLFESKQTLEDGSAISKQFAGKLTTDTLKTKNIIINFDQEIRNLVKKGQSVDAQSILCIIEEAVTSNSNLFNEASLNTLRLRSATSPTANVKGVIDDIKIFYHGDIEDMSPSLAALVKESDKRSMQYHRSINRPPFTGYVQGGMRVKNEPLVLNSAVIKVYIRMTNAMTPGDKLVFFNQAKSIVGEVLPYDLYTERGESIGVVFGTKSFEDRIIDSPVVWGTTLTLARVISKQAAEIYKGKRNV